MDQLAVTPLQLHRLRDMQLHLFLAQLLRLRDMAIITTGTNWDPAVFPPGTEWFGEEQDVASMIVGTLREGRPMRLKKTRPPGPFPIEQWEWEPFEPPSEA